MDKAQIVEGMALVAYHQTAIVAEPREESFDLPAALVAAQRTAVLGLGAYPSAAVGCDHFDPELG
jgi:hypothetical protein